MTFSATCARCSTPSEERSDRRDDETIQNTLERITTGQKKTSDVKCGEPGTSIPPRLLLKFSLEIQMNCKLPKFEICREKFVSARTKNPVLISPCDLVVPLP